jgi:hypothetical protein
MGVHGGLLLFLCRFMKIFFVLVVKKLNKRASGGVCDKVCFHRTNSNVGWQLVIHGVKYFHYDDCVFMTKAPRTETRT